MSKLTIIILLALTLFSCDREVEKSDIADVLRKNTFQLTSVGEKNTITIDFKDSTYSVYEYSDRNLPWRISSFEGNSLLVLDRRIIAIKQIDENTLKGLLIAENDFEVTLNKSQIQWNKDMLNGTWIEERNYELSYNDSSLKTPPPPPPPGFSESSFQEPPLYEIKGDTISVRFDYRVSKSKIDISNSNQFITMELPSDFDRVEKLWKIRKLTDSLMIIDRNIESKNNIYSSVITTEENIKLIKKR